MAHATKEPTGQVNKWEKELADAAVAAADQESGAASGQFFGLKGGRLTFNDAPLLNNEMAVIVLDGILENVFYDGKYDPENPQTPSCFAFGREDKDMKPHEKVEHPVCDKCSSCPNNAFGSAEVGKGKACRNTRRLAMIAAGTMKDGRFSPFEDLEHFESAQVAYMKLPVTSVKGYATFVKQLAGALKRPPFAVFTKVKVVPDDKSQFKVTFEPLAAAPTDLLPVLMARHEEAKAGIDFPYMPAEEGETAAKGKKTPSKKAPAKRKY